MDKWGGRWGAWDQPPSLCAALICGYPAGWSGKSACQESLIHLSWPAHSSTARRAHSGTLPGVPPRSTLAQRLGHGITTNTLSHSRAASGGKADTWRPHSLGRDGRKPSENPLSCGPEDVLTFWRRTQLSCSVRNPIWCAMAW